MRPEVRDAVADWHARHMRGCGAIVEIGALDVNGNLRDIFGDGRYIGVDMRAGPNVDVVLDAHALGARFGAGSVEAIVCCDTFEHDAAFWITLDQIHEALAPGGYFVCSVPTIEFTTFHPNPDDYWRFTRSAFEQIIMPPARYELLDLREIRTAVSVDTLAAIGRRM